MRPLSWLFLIIVYGGLNSLLYVSLLPLWEGFDEPFHYSYVQTLARHQRLPRFGDQPLSLEICNSLSLAPQSYAVKQNLPWVTTFDAYFHMTFEERVRRRFELDSLASDGLDGTCATNYEAHQAPLAYALLAPLDVLLRGSILSTRVWCLRLLCAVSSSVGTAVSLFLLTKRLHLAPVVAQAVIFVTISSQMFYATTAHIANDWLAVPLMICLFERLIAVWENASVKTVTSFGAILAAGLLTKSYFIAFVPLAIGVLGTLMLRRRTSLRALLSFLAVLSFVAGPWYARNVLLYHNLSGMQETMGGVPLAALATSAMHLPWIHSSWVLLLGSLWTGNNSFSTFSRSTLVLLLFGYCVAGAICVYQFLSRRLTMGIMLLIGGSITYVAALAYSAAVTYWASGGKALSPSPWYAEPVVPIILTVLFSELMYFRFHWIVVTWITTLSAYILGATYWVKLIPLYSGFSDGRMTLVRLISWYATPDLLVSRLSETAIKAPFLILPLAMAILLYSFLLAFFLSRGWMRHTARIPSQPGLGGGIKKNGADGEGFVEC